MKVRFFAVLVAGLCLGAAADVTVGTGETLVYTNASTSGFDLVKQSSKDRLNADGQMRFEGVERF